MQNKTSSPSSSNKYSATAMLLHWLVAALIIGTFLLGLSMVAMPGISPTKLKYFSWHKWAGVTVLALVAVRLLWRLFHTPPAYPAAVSSSTKRMAHLAHAVLYVLMVAVPVSGYLYSSAAGFPVVFFGVFPLPTLIDPNPELKALFKQIHYVSNMAMAGLVVLHAAAALGHHVIKRDSVLARMTPFLKAAPQRTEP
jgi:cytochrome b561